MEARGLMVKVTGNGLVAPSSNPGCGNCISLIANTLGKGMNPSLPYYLSIAGGRVGFIPFPRVLALSEMQLPRPGFELGTTSPFPITLTITPRASLQKYRNDHKLKKANHCSVCEV